MRSLKRCGGRKKPTTVNGHKPKMITTLISRRCRCVPRVGHGHHGSTRSPCSGRRIVVLDTAMTETHRESVRVSLKSHPPVEDLAALSGSLPAAPPETRCMGRKCRRVSVVLISAVEEGVAAHTNPARLCEQCASRLGFPSGYPVDIFRWLTDCRVEANA